MTYLSMSHRAMIGVALSGMIWGIYWIPLRALDGNGISGAWAIVVFYALPTAILLPVVIRRRHRIRAGGVGLQAAGVFAGLSLVLYAGALIYTDIVRTLLFYYLTPLWSTLLARIVLGEVITRARWATILLALLGLAVILRLDQGLDISLNTGDWMGLASGVIWAIAAVSIKSDRSYSGVDVALCYFVWGTIIALALAALPLEGRSALPAPREMLGVLPWLLPFVLVLVIPPAFGVMWGATILSPGFLPILFMTEISAGTVTAALWAGEPFGWREMLGIVFITTAGLIEPVLGLKKARPV